MSPDGLTLLYMALLAMFVAFLILWRIVRRAERKLAEMQKAVESSKLDGLTRAFTRSAGRERLNQVTQKAPLQLALMLLDVDKFKLLNDAKGHAAGDKALIATIETVETSLREGDFVTRYGGEEFLVVLPGLSLKEACVVAERIRSALEVRKIKHHNDEFTITVSIGVTLVRPNETNEAAIERADTCLYGAKNEGRNRVVASE